MTAGALREVIKILLARDVEADCFERQIHD